MSSSGLGLRAFVGVDGSREEGVLSAEALPSKVGYSRGLMGTFILAKRSYVTFCLRGCCSVKDEGRHGADGGRAARWIKDMRAA